jgi:23S rRNA pseudouridine1911/1915/1917 synthase
MIEVDTSAHGERLDHFLAAHGPTLSRARLQKLIEQGYVLVNGHVPSKAGQKLRTGDQVTWQIPELVASPLAPSDIPLDIVYEDGDILIINKPVGLVVHPGAGHQEGTLVHALLHHCQDLSGIGGVERPGIVHRLDKDTSGLLAIAKHDQAHVSLSQQLQTRQMHRYYLALAEQGFVDEQGVIEAPIGRHPVERQRMAVVADGRYARTLWQVKAHLGVYTLLELKLDTGRTHQIRVHLKHIQRPLVGDPVYGSRRQHPFRVERPLLHAWKLVLEHPVSGHIMRFEAPLPADFQGVLKRLDPAGKIQL